MGNQSGVREGDYTMKAEADLSLKQYFCVKQGTTKDGVALVAAATDPVFGILQTKPKASGRACIVRTNGKTLAVSDGTAAIAIGDLVGPNAAGKVVKKATADFNAIGRANEPSTADGTIIEVWLGLPQTIFRTLAG